MKLYGIKKKCCKEISNLMWFLTETLSKGGIKTRSVYQCKVCKRTFHTKWYKKRDMMNV